MAALKDANLMPSDFDDITDTTPQPGSADSGATIFGGFTFVPFASFPLKQGVKLDSTSSGGGSGGDGTTDNDDVWAIVE